jgi:TetR/AcrR family transcriptional regulator, regulator of autoinduction and epiphytic fitness
MKTSKAQQDQTRAAIVRATVPLMADLGYDAVTMKAIARSAGVGDATIYKYFPSKERLLLGYIDLVAQDAVEATLATPDFADYDVQARLQRLSDAILERIAPDRAFVALVKEQFSRAPLLMLGDQLAAKTLLKESVAEFLEHGVAKWELPPSDFLRVLSGFYADYCIGIVAYWLADESSNQSDTTRLLDQTLGIFVQMLKSGLPDKLLNLGSFLLRSQFARLLQMPGMQTPVRSRAPTA